MYEQIKSIKKIENIKKSNSGAEKYNNWNEKLLKRFKNIFEYAEEIK